MRLHPQFLPLLSGLPTLIHRLAVADDSSVPSWGVAKR